MLQKLNDTLADAAELVHIVSQIECKVNLIVFNVHEGSEYQPSLTEDVEHFRCYLRHLARLLVAGTFGRARGCCVR
jgi:23S rRNA (adenine2503-C2)-methyltransferase